MLRSNADNFENKILTTTRVKVVDRDWMRKAQGRMFGANLGGFQRAISLFAASTLSEPWIMLRPT